MNHGHQKEGVCRLDAPLVGECKHSGTAQALSPWLLVPPTSAKRAPPPSTQSTPVKGLEVNLMRHLLQEARLGEESSMEEKLTAAQVAYDAGISGGTREETFLKTE